MYKVLVVEDERNTAELVKEALELEDIQVDLAYDGKEGLEKFQTEEYDLILLDLQMPKLTGEELLKEIRKQNPYVDIIVYTNFERFADIKKLVNMGINGYVNKGPSADLQELVQIVKGKLEPMNEEHMIRLINSTQELG